MKAEIIDFDAERKDVPKLAQYSLDMLDCLERRDVHAFVDYFHEEAVWRNMPLPKFTEVQGKESIEKLVNLLFKAFSQFRVHELKSVVQDGNKVVIERSEILTVLGLDMYVEGVSVITFEDGKVISMCDYFDNLSLAVRFAISVPFQLAKKLTS